MTDVYQQLAKKFDEMPHGFPSTDNGTEFRILKKIFTPEEAALALTMKPLGETIDAIASRLGTPQPEMQRTLDEMVKNGQLFTFDMFGEQMYFLPPFVPGILELQL